MGTEKKTRGLAFIYRQRNVKVKGCQMTSIHQLHTSYLLYVEVEKKKRALATNGSINWPLREDSDPLGIMRPEESREEDQCRIVPEHHLTFPFFLLIPL